MTGRKILFSDLFQHTERDKKVIAVVYSGSKYANWRLADKGKIITGFKTTGINPNLQDERFIHQTLNKSNNLINHAEEIRRIYFFGPSASSSDRREKIYTVFEQFFKNARIYVDQDITASARSTLGDSKGLIGVLGSGSNAAYYNGKKITESNFGLGYILADEGSSNWIGRRLLKSFLTETMPDDIRELFVEKHPLDRKQVLEKVYNYAHPTLFLTSFSDFVEEHKSHTFIENMVQEGFRQFIETYLLPLRVQYPDLPVCFAGSIAGTHEADLRKVAGEFSIRIDQIVGEPIHNLLNYYIRRR